MARNLLMLDNEIVRIRTKSRRPARRKIVRVRTNIKSQI